MEKQAGQLTGEKDYVRQIKNELRNSLEKKATELANLRAQAEQLEKDRDAGRATNEKATKLYDQWKQEWMTIEEQLRGSIQTAEERVEELKFEAVEQHDAGFVKVICQVRFFYPELNLDKVCVEANVQNNAWIPAVDLEGEET